MSAVSTIIFLCFICATVHSFIPICAPKLESNTALHLLPSQGCQLAAASAAASVKDEDSAQLRDQSLSDETFLEQMNVKHNGSSQNGIGPTHAAREFVSRVFSIPSYILPHGGSNSQQSWLHNPFENNDVCISDDHNDVVLFPIVGFTFVKTEEDEMKVLPSHNTSRGSCNIDSVRQTKNLPLYGWFSACCPLGDLYADDDSYCGERKENLVERTDL